VSGNSRLAVAAHALAWLGLNQRLGNELSTSDEVAGSVNTNPVVIRRLLGELRDAGLVETRRGAGAGWRLARDLGEITLLDVHDALVPTPLFGLHRATPNQECPVGYGIRPVMSRVFDDVDEVVRQRLARTTLVDVLTEVLAAKGESG